MDEKERGMDRRTLIKSTLAAGAGLSLTASMNDLAWGKSPPGGDLADSSLFQ
jgi:hypothetical protein